MPYFVRRRSEEQARKTKQHLEGKWGVQFPNTGFCNFVKFSIMRHVELRGVEALPTSWAEQAALLAAWFEMAGFNSALNNALQMARRGGHVVLFGVKNGDAHIEDYHRVIMNGLQLHGVVGRQIFGTWEMTRALLENPLNGIQDAVWKVILNEGKGTRVHIDDWEAGAFEQMIRQHPKVLIDFE